MWVTISVIPNLSQLNTISRQSLNARRRQVFCARAYKDYPQLYDVLFLQGTVDESRAAFISHFTLAGVSRENAKAYARKFMGVRNGGNY